MTNHVPRTRGRTLVAALGAIAFAGTLPACNDFLNAENPGAVEADDLNSPAYVNLLTNGVIGEFQPMFATVNYYNALFSDELSNTHVFFEEKLVDLRDVTEENGTYSFFYYGPLHRTRFLADSVAARLNIILGDSASRDLRLARVKAYGGYTYILLAENLCESPIDLSAPLPPSELFQRAVDRFDEAIAVATAAKAVPGASAALMAGADSMINLARVGAARASLGMGDMAAAISYASPVPAAFEMRAYFSENSGGQNNMWWGRISTGSSGSNSAALSYTPFEAMVGDPRIPRPATEERGMNGDSIFIPNSPSAFSTHDGTAVGANVTRSASIRIASGLEARYVIAEAEGATPATLAFVQSRRAAGMQPAATFSGAALMAELRDQRRRDLYLDGHRLGDLRRYIELYSVNDFQTGPYPNTTTGETYADRKCWPLTLAERNGNPNL